MSLHKIKFKLLNYDSWGQDADFERTKGAWLQAAELLSTLTYATKFGLVEINVNWSPVINWLSSSRNKGTIQATVKLHKKMKKEAAGNLAEHCLEVYLNDFFIVVNLAVPGVCNFYNTKILSEYGTRIYLDSFAIEQAISLSKDLGWPIIKDIEMNLVLSWLKALKIGTRQVANSRIERVLFAFLNALHGDVTIVNILWLSHALESFYDTPSIEIVKHLRNRTFKWLSIPEQKRKAIKREFDNFYSIRSAFVHGELEILHPLSNEILDEKVDTQLERIYHANSFGIAMVIASIQSLVENNYYELSFDEIINGRLI